MKKIDKFLIIDSKMREIEKQYFKLKYNLLELKESKEVYQEISSHVDIFCTKIGDKVIVEPTRYEEIKKYYDKIILGSDKVFKDYPNDILYNLCIIGKNAIHNFNYTDKKLIEILEKEGYNKVNIKQGYSKCSVCVLNEKACITTDNKIGKVLSNLDIDTLYIEENNIRLLKDGRYSSMKGFIGGATAVINDTLIIFGDINRLKNKEKIINFVNKYNMAIKDFENLEIIDYGGIIEI